jgi:hypothetical protein
MRGTKALSLLFALISLAVVAPPAAAQVHVTINADGRVTVSAKNATVAQILAEWARVGQTKIVNPERAGGGVLTIELTSVSEVEAIEIILRSAGGYVLAPRRTEMANASHYDRILILPQSAPVSAARPAAATLPQPRPGAPTPAPPRLFAPPQPGQLAVPQTAQDDNDDPADRPAGAPAPVQNVRPPVFNTFPQAAPQRTDPPAPPAPASTVTVPVGVAVPGMVAPTPQPAGQPGVVAQPPPQQR